MILNFQGRTRDRAEDFDVVDKNESTLKLEMFHRIFIGILIEQGRQMLPHSNIAALFYRKKIGKYQQLFYNWELVQKACLRVQPYLLETQSHLIPGDI